MREIRTPSSLLTAVAVAAALAQGLMLPTALSAQQRTTLPERPSVLTGEPAPVFSIGREEGESWEMLSDVRAVVFDGQEHVYVLDAGNFRVLVFDRSGTFVRQIGKQGNGPGELTFPSGIAIAVDGNVVVADVGRGGYAIFRPDGEYVKNLAFPQGMRPALVPGGGGLYIDATGSAIYRAMPGLMGGGEGPRRPPTQSPILRHALSEHATPSTLYTIPLPEPRVQDRNEGGGRVARMIMYQVATFAAPVTWSALSNGSVVVNHDPEYAVKVVDASGRAARVIGRDERPREVTERDMEDARAQLREQLESGGGGGVRVVAGPTGATFSMGSGGGQMTPEQIEQNLRQMTFAEVMPLVQAIRTDPLGRIWIERTGERVGEDGPIDLVTAEGRYIGTLEGQRLPDAVSATGLAAYIERDALDVQRVVVRRLPDGWR